MSSTVIEQPKRSNILADYEIATFHLTDKKILNTQLRRVISSTDCVLNALQLIGHIDDRHADLMRILIGDQGIAVEKIAAIFHFLHPRWDYKFQEYHIAFNRKMIEHIINSIETNQVIYAVNIWRYPQGAHAFLIGKNSSGELYIIDPQQQNIIQDVLSYLLASTHIAFLLRRPSRKRSRSKSKTRTPRTNSSGQRTKRRRLM